MTTTECSGLLADKSPSAVLPCLLACWPPQLSVLSCGTINKCLPPLQDDPNATVDTVIWASPNSVLVCFDSGPDADQAHMAMITWQLPSDPSSPLAPPQGLAVLSAESCEVQQATCGQQMPHMKAVLVPQWNLLVAVHRNSHNYHLKVFGE